MKPALLEVMRMNRICRMVLATCLGSFILVIFYFQRLWFLFKSYCSREACQGWSSPSLVSSSTVCSLPLSPGNSPGLSVRKDCSLYLKTSLDPVEHRHIWKHDFHL